MRRAAMLPACLAAAVSASSCGGPQKGSLLEEYRVQPTRRQLRRVVWLTSFASDELGGSLSPDGFQLVYASDQKGQLDIWLKDLRTGLPRRLTRDVAADEQPAWSPDGKSVVFVSRRKDAKGDLYLWRDGKLRRLTTSRTADSYPTFSADGHAVYYASGGIDRTRIHRLQLDTKQSRPVTGWGATHPAVSADGRYLAFTRRDGAGSTRIAVKELGGGKLHFVTAGRYHAGFPSFSPSGRRLVFSRFYRGPPNKPREPEATASLWTVELDDVFGGVQPDELLARAHQLTGDNRQALLARWHRRGIAVTLSRSSDLDVALLPPTGLVPSRRSAREQLELALAQDDPWQRLLCLRSVLTHDDRRIEADALYRSGALFSELGELDKARRAFARTRRLAPGTVHAGLAQIDAVTLVVERARKHAGGASAELRPAARRAKRQLERLKLPDHARVEAHLALRIADMLRLDGKTRQAIDAYEAVLGEYKRFAPVAAEAQLRLGQLFGVVREPRLVADYYLTLFPRYPAQRDILEAAARQLLERFSKLPRAEQIEQLRTLIDTHRDYELFVAMALQHIAELYEKQGQLALAIRAMSDVGRVAPRGSQLASRAAFAVGRLSLAHSRALRREGRTGEALELYDRALRAYERIMKSFEPGTEARERARREYIRLSLLQAAELVRSGERTLAEKRYRRVLDTDDRVLHAHRELIRLQDAAGRARLAARYRSRRDRDPADFVANYALGYIATFGDQLTAEQLDGAQQQLAKATALGPQSPFGHMTLGWVHEMRERYLGRRGELEEALVRYERAYELNDVKVDPQTEADLLIDLVNAYVALGSDWSWVKTLCQRREKLGFPFRTAKQAAFHRLSCGRAASATGDFDRARELYEQSLKQARRLGLSRFEIDIVGRLALNEHLRGDFGASNRLFRQLRTLVARQGRATQLPAIERMIAYNAILAGNDDGALAQLSRARRALEQHPPADQGGFIPVALSPDPSSAPFGFDRAGERYGQLALTEIIAENRARWRRALELQRQRAHVQGKRIEELDFPETHRELLLLRNRIALSAHRLGLDQLAAAQLDLALGEVEKLRDGGDSSPQTRAIEVGLAVNAAELALASSPQTARPSPRLRGLHRRLRRLESATTGDDQPVLGARLRIAVWNDLALLTLRDPQTARSRGGSTAGGSHVSELRSVNDESSPAGAALGQLLDTAAPYAAAIELWQRIARETELEARPLEPAAAKELRDSATAPLWRPFTGREQLRTHVLAVLNIAWLSCLATPAERLEKHPSTALLERTARSAVGRDLGALRYLLSSELAYRRGDLRGMQSAVDGFLQRHPLVLGPDYVAQAEQIRARLFARAIALALRRDRVDLALAFAEQRDRRAFVDALVHLPPAGVDRAATPLRELLSAAKRYRAHYLRQDPRASDEQLQRWRAGRDKAERAVRTALKRLDERAPAVGDLLAAGAFPLDELRRTLGEHDVAVRAVRDNTRALLVAVRGVTAADQNKKTAPTKETAGTTQPTTRAAGTPGVRALTLDLPASQLRRMAGSDPAALKRRLTSRLRQLTRGARRIYLDLGEIDPAARLMFDADTVRVATLWELLDARRARTVRLPGGTVAGKDVKALAETLSYRALSGDRVTPSGLERAADASGTLVIAAPLSFEGGSAANFSLELDREEAGWRPARALGRPLRASLLVLSQVTFAPTRKRAQRVALLRLLHALGTTSVMLPHGRPPTSETLASLVGAIEHGSLAGAAGAAKMQLFGDEQIPAEQRKARAKRRLKKSVFAGAGALKRSPPDLAATVRHLEAALRYMAIVGDDKYMDGTLSFLTAAYTRRKEPQRAVARMKRLLARKRTAVAEAKANKKLVAKAAYVKALQKMAWLRLRNEQYDLALKANRRAIDIYRAVKRPLMARAAYEQRSIIASKKGDKAEALRYARRNFETAQKLAKQPKADTGAKLTAAEAALRVARLLRVDQSQYRAAARAVEQAEALLPTANVAEIGELTSKLDAMRGRLSGLKGKKRAALIAAGRKLHARRAQLQRVVEAKRGVLLARARIQTARGVYADAVRQAQAALELLEQAGLERDLPLLEIVNNLYYMGAYRRALKRAAEGLKLSTKKPRRRVQFLNARGTALSRLGEVDQALAALDKALKQARRMNDPRETAATLNNFGDALRAAGRFREARKRFEAALAIDHKQQDKLGTAFDMANLGLTNMLLKLDDEARRQLKRALKLATEIGSSLNQLKALIGLGRIALRHGDHGHALERANTAHAVASKLGLRDWMWKSLLLAGRALRAGGRDDGALSKLRAALEIVDHQPPRPLPRPGATRIDLRPSDVYDELIDLLARRKDAAGSFLTLERLLARSFIDRVSSSATEVAWPEARAALRRYSDLDRALEATRAARLRAAGRRAEQRALDARADELRQQRAAAAKAIAAINPGLLQLLQPEVRTVAQLREQLANRDDTVLVSFYAARRQLLIWTLDHDSGLKLHRRRIGRRTLQSKVEDFRHRLLHFDDPRRPAIELYRLLLRDVIASHQGAQLVLVASGALQLLPFAALHDGEHYLGGRHTLSYLPQASALANAGSAPAGRRFDSWISFSWTGTPGAPLPFTARESTALGRSFSSVRVYQASEATRAGLAEQLPTVRNLHLATHAELRSDDLLASSWQLHDGRFTLLDLLGKRLRADLVVLSACNTGRAIIDGADSVSGMQRAVLAAGAKRVLSTLWRVSDLGAALLMKHFFRALARTDDPASALRAAQAEVQRRHPHPAFWAGFRLDD